MARTIIFLVCDDVATQQKVQSFGQANGITVQTFGPGQWVEGLRNEEFVTNLTSEYPGVGAPAGVPNNVIPFPRSTGDDKRVSTMNELESMAITNAINEFNGNLTEAAKALGIGRATLYRKVKQYNIDPSQARKNRRAA